ncbi:hypothetical protein [Olleya sp. R77988]|uniref:hypothetical protein n=1 Tax=Olleya sp. R77988 TaxID=3093875 RepID=UPI0037CB80E2
MKDNNLHNIKETGFKTPQNYFEGLEDRILTHATLESLTKSTGFKTPEDYFDTIETSVLEKLNKPEPKVIPLFRRKSVLAISSIAAALVLFFSLNLFNNTSTIEIDHLDTVTVEDYLLDELETTDLSLLISNTELTQSHFIDYNVQSLEDYIDTVDLDELYD